MKKLFYILFLAFFTITFVACVGNDYDERVLDFKSMRDVELDVIISLGDSRERVEELLGQPIWIYERTEWSVQREITYLDFENGMNIHFERGSVRYIRGINEIDSGRFEIYRYTIGMTLEEIGDTFEQYVAHDDTLFLNFNIFYDENGNIVGYRNHGESNLSPCDNTVVFNYISQPPDEDGIVLQVVSRF